MPPWLELLRQSGLPVEPVPDQPDQALLQTEPGPLQIRSDGFFFLLQGTWPGLPRSLGQWLQISEGLPYLKLLPTAAGVELRGEVTGPERIRDVWAALPELSARLAGETPSAPPGEDPALDPVALLLQPLTEARGGHLRPQGSGWCLQFPHHYPLTVQFASPGVRLRLAFWAFQPHRPPAYEAWLLGIQRYLRFIKATPEGLGSDLPQAGLNGRELGLAVDGLLAAEDQFGPAARALQEPLVAALYHHLAETRQDAKNEVGTA